MARDSVGNTLLVATVLCVVCSVLVASAAVGLRGIQEANKFLDQKKNVLIAAGKFRPGENTDEDINPLFEASVTRVLINLATGTPVDSADVDAENYDQRAAARNPDLNEAVEPPNALNGVKQREKYAFVYEIQDESGIIEKIVLPIYGKGLWSTMYGFLAVATDGSVVRGITFYEHGETPGLGGEIENRRWQESWKGKLLLDASGDVAIQVIKGTVNPGAAGAEHQIDGLSGATITSNGVNDLIRYWMGPQAFGTYLEKLRQSSAGGQRG